MTFEDIVRKPQHTLKKALVSELNRMGYKTITKRGFLYAKGSRSVMLVAHLDTVHREPVKTICYSPDGKVVMSPQGIGGDDRAGVYMILQIIRKHRCHVLFCEDEETGGIGATKFVQSGIRPKINYIVELDRHGSDDAVFYDCDNPDFTEFVCGFGFQEEFGSFSDISILAPELEIAAVNISAGYYNEHSKHEYVDMDAVNQNIQRVSRMVSTHSDYFEYIEAVRFSRWNFMEGFDRYRWFDSFDWKSGTGESREVQQLKTAAEQFGVLDYEVDLLLDCGYYPEDIEMLLNFPQEMRRTIHELLSEEVEMESDITEIRQEQADAIIDTRDPLGLFYLNSGGHYIGIDNSTGDAWTEEFSSLRQCKNWLRNPTIVVE